MVKTKERVEQIQMKKKNEQEQALANKRKVYEEYEQEFSEVSKDMFKN